MLFVTQILLENITLADCKFTAVKTGKNERQKIHHLFY